MKLLLLGSNDFVGKVLGVKLENIHELVRVNRETNLVNLLESDQVLMS
jgi:hypothetical protein